MDRAYIGSQVPLEDALEAATQWQGGVDCIIAPSTRAIEGFPWLERKGIPLGVASNRRSRFTARPHGVTVALRLDLDEILELENRNRAELSAVVAVHPSTRLRPWITAHDAECIDGEALAPIPETPPAIRAIVNGLSGIAVLNQGLVDRRERYAAIQALTFFHVRGHTLDPDQLITEAIRNGWPGDAPVEFAGLARRVNAGQQLRYQNRIVKDLLEEWATTR